MGRIRTVKPEFFVHDGLFDLEVGTRSAAMPCGLPLRLAFAGLWTCADRDGIFEWRPRMLKPQVLPHDDVSFDAVLDHLERGGFVTSYEVDGKKYGYIPSWKKHQSINNREQESILPAPPAVTRQARVTDATEGKGREGKGKEGKGIRADDAKVDPPIAPEMITRSILVELGISGRDLSVVLDEVCRSQMKHYPTPGNLRDAMVDSWRQYDAAKPNLEYAKGPAKFFGDGDWRNKAGWPWKQGAPQQSAASPKPKYMTPPRRTDTEVIQ